MHFFNFLLAASFALKASAGVCWTSPLGILLGAPPRKSLFGPPAQQGDCNLPLQNGGRPAPAPPPPAPAPPGPVTVYITTTETTTVQIPPITACTSTTTLSACTSTETTCTSTVTACTSTETIYSIDPASVAAGNAKCTAAYGTARPSALYNYLGKPKCCAPIKEFDALGNLKAQCLGGP